MQQKLNLTVALGAVDKLTGPLNAARAASRQLGASIKSVQDELQLFTRQTRQLERAENEIKKKSDQLTHLLDQRKALKAQPLISDEQKAQIDALGKSIGRLDRQIKAEKEHASKLTSELERYGIKAREYCSVTDQIAHATKRYNQQLQTQEALLKRVTDAQSKYDRAKKKAERVRNAGLKMGAVGGGILWGGLRGMQVGMEFDEAYSRTLADAQLTRDSAEGKALREQAKHLARTTHFSAVQATQGQDALISGGLSSENARKALPGVLNMALAAKADLGEAANVGSGIFDAFQMDASQMDRVGDVLVATFTKSKTTLESLGETMKYAGPVAHQAGMSLEETAAASAMLAKNGLEGSMAGTGLKSVINGLYAPAKAGADILDALKIRTVTATGALRPMAEVLQELHAKIRRFDKGSQLDIYKNLFGQEGMGAGMILAKSVGEGAYQDFLTYLERAQGISARTSAVMTDNFNGDMQMLHSAWAGFWTQLEDGPDSVLRSVVQKVTSMLQSITDWMAQHPVLTNVLVTATLVAGAVLAVGGAVLAALGAIMAPLASIQLGMELLASGGITSVGAAFGWLGGVAAGVFESVIALLAGISAPVWGLIAVFAVACAAIIYWWEYIKAFVAGVFEGAFEVLAPLLAKMMVIWDGLGKVFRWLWDKVCDFLTPVQATHETLDKCASAGRTVGKVLGQAFRSLLTPLEALMDGISWVLEKLGVIPDAAAEVKKKVDEMHASLKHHDEPPPQTEDKKDTGTPSGNKSPKPGTSGKPVDVPKMPEFGTAHFELPDDKKGRKAKAPAMPAVPAATAEASDRPGDIVFKSLPSWIPLRNGFSQPVLAAGHAGIVGMATEQPVAASKPEIGTNVDGDINLHIHVDGAHMDRRELVNDIERQIMAALNKLKRQQLASLSDRE
ncbi:phage tail tape measure protein [Escherichia coli]|uniref:phage tail tape measure protein n=1 Tax=Escherichia coli TaxID=562 RepID=UPI00135EEE07|nr:phage tail tape measure protein [Escherichia coli]MXF04481.1 phage tail tape measure protein [Escherichia coli]